MGQVFCRLHSSYLTTDIFCRVAAKTFRFVPNGIVEIVDSLLVPSPVGVLEYFVTDEELILQKEVNIRNVRVQFFIPGRGHDGPIRLEDVNFPDASVNEVLQDSMNFKMSVSLHGRNDIFFDELGDDLRFLVGLSLYAVLMNPDFPPGIEGNGNNQEQAGDEDDLGDQ